MSYICDKCGKVQPPKTKPHVVITQTRQKPTGGSEIAKSEKQCNECHVPPHRK